MKITQLLLTCAFSFGVFAIPYQLESDVNAMSDPISVPLTKGPKNRYFKNKEFIYLHEDKETKNWLKDSQRTLLHEMFANKTSEGREGCMPVPGTDLAVEDFGKNATLDRAARVLCGKRVSVTILGHLGAEGTGPGKENVERVDCAEVIYMALGLLTAIDLGEHSRKVTQFPSGKVYNGTLVGSAVKVSEEWQKPWSILVVKDLNCDA